jgi:hypothetical protein
MDKPQSKAEPEAATGVFSRGNPQSERRWLLLGYLLTALLLVFRLGYIASGTIELSNDEAYQWLWSKHLALSYFSKPPGIAFLQFAGTALWGDTQFGVRFFSPVFAAVLSIVVLRFMAREAGARAGFLLLLIVTSAPLLSMGAILMTIDPPLVLCCTLAMIAGWRAVQPGARITQWLLAGVTAGLGFLFKYSAIYLLLCWALFFLLWPPARAQLKKPGPYLALLIFALCALPVLIWNARNGWITLHHIADHAALVPESHWRPTLRYFWDFLLATTVLLNPVFFVGALWAMAAFWKRQRESPLELYCFCFGGVVFLGHLIYSLHSRILPNWIAIAVLPMYLQMVLYWEARWREGARAVESWLVGGLAFGLIVVGFLHNTNLTVAMFGRLLPGDADPLRRVRGYRESAAWAEQARENLLRKGKPAFIICEHYGITGLFTFYLPEARAALRTQPLVYCITSSAPTTPDSQFYFWPEYRYPGRRNGENAIYVIEPGTATLENGWFSKWLAGQEVRVASEPNPVPPPPVLLRQFDSVTDLGVKEIKVDGRIMKRVQLFECLNLH